MKKKRGLVLINQEHQWELLEALYKLPVEEREAALAQAVKDGKAVYLGSTTQTAPELAIELLKNGVNATSFVQGEKANDK